VTGGTREVKEQAKAVPNFARTSLVEGRATMATAAGKVHKSSVGITSKFEHRFLHTVIAQFQLQVDQGPVKGIAYDQAIRRIVTGSGTGQIKVAVVEYAGASLTLCCRHLIAPLWQRTLFSDVGRI
jgi:hypothetical protein